MLNRIPLILEQKGWSKYKLAIETGISHPTILKIVNSPNQIPPRTTWETIKNIAKALEVKTDDLETEDDGVK